MRRLRATMALVPFAAACVVLWAFVIVPWRCGHLKRESEAVIERVANSEHPAVGAVAEIRNISARLHRCIEYMPGDLDLRMEAAACALMLGRTNDAIAQYRAALKIDRRPEIYLNLGAALYVIGRREEAISAFARVYSFASFMVNYDSRLPWSGERVIDLVPAELQESVIAEARRQRVLLGRRP